MSLAFTHPGKVGDLLYALPTVKKICNAKGAVCDFYTSDYCYPIVKQLLQRQSYIENVYSAHNYKIERMDMGVQPWRVPVNLSNYETTYHLGFRSVPDKAIPEFIANSVGVSWDGKIEYEYDPLPTLDRPYIVMAPRGDSTYKELFLDVTTNSTVDVVMVGAESDYIGVGINKCGLDLLQTLPWIANSIGFIGLMSSQLVLANGFDIPRISPHDNIHWDMRHVVQSEKNFYPINPTYREILEILRL